MNTSKLAFLDDMLGKELGPSDTVRVTQERIDAFADATLDHQWIHVDRERAAAGPFGGTVGHGYLTLALLVHLLSTTGLFPPGVTVINYGIDKVRFPAPLPSGSSVRLTGRIVDLQPKGDQRVLAKIACEVTAEGATTPALVAEVLYLYMTD